jgi:hypothetical protein
VDQENLCDLRRLFLRETLIEHLHELVKRVIGELVLVCKAEFSHQDILRGHRGRGRLTTFFASLMLRLGLAEEMGVTRR